MAFGNQQDREEFIRLYEQNIKSLLQSNKLSTKELASTGRLYSELVKLNKRLDEGHRGSRGLGSVFSTQRTQYELARLNPLSRTIFQSFFGSISGSEEKQIRTLAFGRNLKQSIGGKGNELAQGIGGFSEQLEAQLLMQERGFKDVNKTVRDLVVRMRLTGQDENKLIDVLRNSQVIGGVTNKGLERLAASTDKAYKEYGVRTEVLVDAISKLDNEIELNILGSAETVKGAIIDLTKQYGDTAGNLIKRFVETSTDINNLEFAIRAGIQDQISVLTDSTSTQEEASQALEEAMLKLGGTMKEQFNQLKSQGTPVQVSLEILKQLYGDFGQLSLPLMNIDKNSKMNLAATHEANESFTAYLKEFPSKLQQTMTELFGSNISEQIEFLKSIDAGIWLMATTLVGKNAYDVGSFGANLLAKNSKLLGKLFGTGAGAAAGGEATAGGLAGLTAYIPHALIAAGVLYGGYKLYDYLENDKSDQIDEILKKQVEEVQVKNSKQNLQEFVEPNQPVKTPANNYDAMMANINKKNSDLLQSMLIELKKSNNNKYLQPKVNVGGM